MGKTKPFLKTLKNEMEASPPAKRGTTQTSAGLAVAVPQTAALSSKGKGLQPPCPGTGRAGGHGEAGSAQLCCSPRVRGVRCARRYPARTGLEQDLSFPAPPVTLSQCGSCSTTSTAARTDKHLAVAWQRASSRPSETRVPSAGHGPGAGRARRAVLTTALSRLSVGTHESSV